MKFSMLNVQQALAQLNNMTPNNTEITLTLTIEEANIVLAGLQELPGKVCNPITQKIQQQAQTQLAPKVETPAE